MSKKKRRRKTKRYDADFFSGTRMHESIDFESGEKTAPIIEEVEDGDSTESPNREELLKELNVLSIRIDALTTILVATSLDLYHNNRLKAETLDSLYDTNHRDNFIDTTHFPRLTSTIFVFVGLIFLNLNYTLLQERKYEHMNDYNHKEVVSAWKAFLASIFVSVGGVINLDNVDP